MFTDLDRQGFPSQSFFNDLTCSLGCNELEKLEFQLTTFPLVFPKFTVNTQVIPSIYSYHSTCIKLQCNLAEMKVLLLTLLSITSTTWAYNQNPKVYVDVECISFADPLVNGFNVILPKQLFDDHLTADKFPVIYASAIPLASSSHPVDALVNKRLFDNQRDILYLDEVQDKLVHFEGLKAASWYYVCVEFENMHRHHRVGNTSTTCKLYRTLDQFGELMIWLAVVVVGIGIGHSKGIPYIFWLF